MVEDTFSLIESNKHLNAFVTLNKEASLKKAENLDNNPSELPLSWYPYCPKRSFLHQRP